MRSSVVNIYKNEKQLASLGVAQTRDFDVLVDDSSQRKKKLPKARPTGTREQRAATRAREKSERDALKSRLRLLALQEKHATAAEKRAQRDADEAAKKAQRDADKAAKKAQRDNGGRFTLDVLDNEYNGIWWELNAPAKISPVESTAIPELMEAMKAHIAALESTRTASGYSTVYQQTNNKNKDKGEKEETFVERGYFSQLSVKGHPQLRLSLVREPVVAALITAAALIDKRIRSKKVAHSWLHHMAEHPDDVQRWLQEVDLTPPASKKTTVGRRATPQDVLATRREKAIEEGRFRPLKASTHAAPQPVGLIRETVPPDGTLRDEAVYLRKNDGVSARVLREEGATFEQLREVYDLTQLVDAFPLKESVAKGVALDSLIQQGVAAQGSTTRVRHAPP